MSAAGPLCGQALRATEIGVGAAVVLAQRDFFGAELRVARRTTGQGRLSFAAACGDYEHSLGVRFEATAQFMLRPAERTGAGPYGGLGLTFVGAEGTAGATYLTTLLGVEQRPGTQSGWYAEVGLGGGVRFGAGWRFRRFPKWWSP